MALLIVAAQARPARADAEEDLIRAKIHTVQEKLDRVAKAEPGCPTITKGGFHYWVCKGSTPEILPDQEIKNRLSKMQEPDKTECRNKTISQTALYKSLCNPEYKLNLLAQKTQLEKELNDHLALAGAQDFDATTLVWEGSPKIEAEGEVTNYPSFTFTAKRLTVAIDGDFNIDLTCTGKVATAKPTIGTKGEMDCTAKWERKGVKSTMKFDGACVGYARVECNNHPFFFCVPDTQNCKGATTVLTPAADGKPSQQTSTPMTFGKIGIRGNKLGSCCNPP